MSNVENAVIEEFVFNKLQRLIIALPPEEERGVHAKGLWEVPDLSEMVEYLWLENFTDFVLTIPASFNVEMRSILNEYGDLPLGELINKPLMKMLNVTVLVRPYVLTGAVHIAVHGDGVNDLSEDQLLFLKKEPDHLMGGYQSSKLQNTNHVAVQEPINQLFTSTDKRLFNKRIGTFELDGELRACIYSKPKPFGDKEIQLFLNRRNKDMSLGKWITLLTKVYGPDIETILDIRALCGFHLPCINVDVRANGKKTEAIYFYVH